MTTKARTEQYSQQLVFELAFWTPFWLVPFLATYVFGYRPGLRDLIVSVGITGGLAALAAMFGRHRRYFYLIAGIVLLIGAIATTGFEIGSAETPNAVTLESLLNTNLMEAFEFAQASSQPVVVTSLVLSLLALLIPFVLLTWRWRKLNYRSPPQFTAAFVVVFLLPSAAKIGLMVYHRVPISQLAIKLGLQPTGIVPYHHYLPFQTYLALVYAVRYNEEFADMRPAKAPSVRMIGKPSRPLSLIVVVGETFARSHMHLYGYCRNTTPFLDSMGRQLIRFQSAYSPVPVTAPALSTAFLLDAKSARKRAPGATVFDAFNAAGFDTWWISNQPKTGLFQNLITMLSRAAKHHIWTNVATAWFKPTDAWDSRLLPPLKRTLGLTDRNRAIFLHMMGGHLDYEDRVPPAYHLLKFPQLPSARSDRQKAEIDNYDRTMRYTDFILSRVVSLAKQAKGDVAIVIFGDHGEETYSSINYDGHNFPMTTPDMKNIPLLVWLSPSYRADHPETVRALAAVKGKPFAVGDLSRVLFEVAGFTVSGSPGLLSGAPSHATPPEFSLPGLRQMEELPQKAIYGPLCSPLSVARGFAAQ